MEGVVAHPMPGWIAAVPIPGGHEEGDSIQTETILGTIVRQTPGIMSALVVEVGEPLPGYPVPFTAGAKVYYRDDSGITIGERTFIAQNTPICYEDGE